MSTYGFAAMLAPRSVVVVGAGEREGSVGRAVIDSLRAGGFDGAIRPVNPNYRTIDGERCFPSLTALPETPGLVLIATPPETVPGIVEEAGACGAAAAAVLSAHLGRGEAAPIGAARRAARQYGLRLLGPDSIGLAVPDRRLNATLLAHPPRAGDLALVTQSGTVASAIAAWAHRREVGFSAILTTGRSADVDAADTLDHFAADIHTRAILLSLHRVEDARKFLSAARAAARVKPVVVLRTGRHEAHEHEPQTHTGALARPDAVYAAAFRRAGLLSVDTLDEMFSAAETLRRQRPFPGNRLMIVANGRGIGALAADRLAEQGGTAADASPETLDALKTVRHGTSKNPIDLGVDAQAHEYATALGPLLACRGNDALLAVHVPTARAGARATARAVVGAVTAARRGGDRKKPVFAVSVGEDAEAAAIYAEAGIPLFATDADAVDGFLHVVRYREAQEALMRTPASLPQDFRPDVDTAKTIVAEALAAGQRWLDPLAVERLLAAYAIPMQPSRLAADGAAAAEAAWPTIARGEAVALKLVSPDIVHKSDVGGVRLGLTSEADVREAAAGMAARARALRPDARITGFAVQAMVPRGNRRELIVGLAEDPTFGPVVVFGRGGTAVEVIDDRSLGLPPLDLQLAADQILRTRVARRLAAYRDVPAADMSEIALVLVKLAQLAADLPEMRELDINPLLADSDGILGLDGRIRVQPEPARRRPLPGGDDRRATRSAERHSASSNADERDPDHPNAPASHPDPHPEVPASAGLEGSSSDRGGPWRTLRGLRSAPAPQGEGEMGSTGQGRAAALRLGPEAEGTPSPRPEPPPPPAPSPQGGGEARPGSTGRPGTHRLASTAECISPPPCGEEAGGGGGAEGNTTPDPLPSPPAEGGGEARHAPTWHPRFAIRPYPVEWERTMTLKGRAIRVRPVRPEDEGLFAAFFSEIDPEDVRLRFFTPMRHFSHAFLARLTQLDYARAIAFVAIDAADDTMLGAVRLHADANHESGEFAILVRSDIKGVGLGYALMRMMLDWARAEGISRVEGSVLAENRAMLAVCRRLGFRITSNKYDTTLLKAEITQ